MTVTTTPAPENVALADRAERILEVLRYRDPTEADTQACSMVMAGLSLLRDRRGTGAVVDMLCAVSSVLVGPGDGSAAAAPAVAVPAPVASPTAAEVGTAIRDHLHAMPRDVGAEHARAAIAGGGVFLREAFGEAAALDALAGVTDAVRDAKQAEAPPKPEPRHHDPDAMALSLLDDLRGTAPDLAHEQARAAIVGAAAYLVEARGPIYTSAVIDGLVINATRHIETWGASPRPAGVPLH